MPDNCILVPITVIGTVMICIVHKFIEFLVFIQIHLACVAFIVFIIFIMSAGLAIIFISKSPSRKKYSTILSSAQPSWQEVMESKLDIYILHAILELWKVNLTLDKEDILEKQAGRNPQRTRA